MRAVVAVLAMSGSLMMGNVALADSISGTITVGDQTEVLYKKEAEKTTATGTDAKITINTRVPAKDMLTVNIVNKYDNIASLTPAQFQNTGAGTKKSISYMDGKGKKGNPFRPLFTYRGTDTQSFTFSFVFVP